MRRVTFLVAVVMLAACSTVPEVTAPETSQGSITVPALPPTTVEDVAGLCHGYLVLLRSGDDAPLREALDDSDLIEALDVMLSSEGEFAAIAQAAVEVEQAVLDRCAERFAVGTEPAPDDAAALTVFMDALLAGNQAAAEPVAWENVIAQFEPWSPPPSADVGGSSYEVDGSTATAVLQTITVLCTAEGGVVVSCRYGE